MRIVTNNLGVEISEKYTWEYMYKGLLFFLIGLMFSWYKLGRALIKFIMWFGKFCYETMMKVGDNYGKKQRKKSKNK